MGAAAVVVPPDEIAMCREELCARLRISRATFYRLEKAGKLDRFECKPRLGPRRYSRKLVQAFVDGALGVEESTFRRRA
jgi:predicted DNA-binding transcriptional regulator AlpA